MSFVVCSLWVDATPWMDDHGSPGRVGAVDQGTTSKVREVASSFPSETNASSPSVWRAGEKDAVIPRPATDPVRCVSPDLARVTAQERARKLENALEVMSDVDRPAVEALRVELKKTQNASAVPPLDVQIQQCESFISRSERRLAEIDAQRLSEEGSLTEGRARLERLRSETNRLGNRGQEAQTTSCRVAMSEAAVQPCPSVPPCAIFCRGSPDGPGTSGQAQSLCRGSAFNGASAEWLCAKHLELRDALEMGDPSVVAELSQLLAAGAVKMQTLSGAVSMVANSVR